MTYSTTVSPKGWVVIPKELRKRYNLSPGTRITFVDYGGMVTIVPIPDNPIADTFGLLKDHDLTGELLKARQEEREHEELRVR